MRTKFLLFVAILAITCANAHALETQCDGVKCTYTVYPGNETSVSPTIETNNKWFNIFECASMTPKLVMTFSEPVIIPNVLITTGPGIEVLNIPYQRDENPLTTLTITLEQEWWMADREGRMVTNIILPEVYRRDGSLIESTNYLFDIDIDEGWWQPTVHFRYNPKPGSVSFLYATPNPILATPNDAYKLGFVDLYFSDEITVKNSSQATIQYFVDKKLYRTGYRYGDTLKKGLDKDEQSNLQYLRLDIHQGLSTNLELSNIYIEISGLYDNEGNEVIFRGLSYVAKSSSIPNLPSSSSSNEVSSVDDEIGMRPAKVEEENGEGNEDVDPNALVVVKADINDFGAVAVINKPSFTFNYPVTIAEGAKAIFKPEQSLKNQREVDILKDPENDNVIYLDLENIVAKNKASYLITIKEGLISREDMSEVVNPEICVYFEGTTTYPVTFKSYSVNDKIGYPASIDFEVVEAPSNSNGYMINSISVLSEDGNEVIVDGYDSRSDKKDMSAQMLSLYPKNEFWYRLEPGKNYILEVKGSDIYAVNKGTTVESKCYEWVFDDIRVPFHVPELIEDVAPLKYTFNGKVHFNGHKKAAVKPGDEMPTSITSLHLALDKTEYLRFNVFPVAENPIYVDVFHVTEAGEELYERIPCVVDWLNYWDALHYDNFVYTPQDVEVKLEAGETYRLRFAENQLKAKDDYKSYSGWYYPSAPWMKQDAFEFEFVAGQPYQSSVAETLGELDGAFDVYRVDGTCVLHAAEADALNTLAPGLYLVNGRKLLISK